jgi:hypothetical protein
MFAPLSIRLDPRRTHRRQPNLPVRRVGRDGKYDYQAFGDSPEHNRLFKMMHELSVELCEGDLDGSSEIGDCIYSWSDFCRIAYEAYEKDKKAQ